MISVPEPLKPAVSLLLWFSFNISTVILNKYLYVFWSFTYPLTLTCIHMLVCSVGTFLILDVFKWWPKQPVVEKKKRIWPFALIFCFNIVLGNVSLRFVPVSFMQTIKSSVPALTVILQSIIYNVHFSKQIKLSLVPIVGGVALSSITEVNFQMIGFLAAVLSSFTTAFQTIFSSVLLGGNKLDSVNLLYNMAPVALSVLSPFAFFMEYGTVSSNWHYSDMFAPYVILFVSGSLALGLNFTTFLAIQWTSPLTFNVAGNFKVVLSIIISVICFKNKITFLSGFGCAAAVCGVIAYNQIKFGENQAKAQAASRKPAKLDSDDEVALLETKNKE